ncbi:hydroxymethylbilane synthase [Mangrovivirga cuniculi]|uniref:Porphobilinogen deaminase n=1 Tax=Mangrovivirga cuniculi TaxID=2715131 RepID=A0A4D7JR82_9BACT|nr:hydroxymethylbilane synthase [Mangrovivirga cuniculi]QCK14186.1 hydroxymethylbilane synthase [Mangrovivirga cuniculi]
MKEVVKIVTRKSQLAMWQTNYIEDLLNEAGFETEIIKLDTIGDKILDVAINKIGSKGVFTEELEAALYAGEAHIAVHSAKDMPSSLPDGLELIAFTKREKMHDVLVSDKDIDLTGKLTIGTSSTRRVAMHKRFNPHFNIVDMRGNLQTRIGKMRDGHCDALHLAFAGVHRMGYEDLIKHHFDLSVFTPAVGQGSIAIEASTSLNPELKQKIIEAVNDTDTHACLAAERAFLKKLEGGCSVPVFGLASQNGDQISLRGGIVSLDGQTMIDDEVTGSMSESRELGEKLGDMLISRGGKELLNEIKRGL